MWLSPEITYQKSMKNILHQSYLLKLLLSRIVFAIIWKFFRTTIKNDLMTYGRVVSSFLMVLQIFSGFFFKQRKGSAIPC